MGVLPRWLSDPDRRDLLASRAARKPYAAPHVVPDAARLFDWALLDGILAARPAPEVLVVRESALLAEPPPDSGEAARAMFERGVGLVVRRAECHHIELRTLAHAFEQALSGSAHVQLFATPAATHGFGWHYDAEDVFILQTWGRKSYYFRDNSQQPSFDPREPPDFSKIRTETSPMATCTLDAGDALFLPRGMWHVAKARTDSLSISLGLTVDLG